MSSIKTWYPRYVADYAVDTSHLDTLQHGAYTLLLDHSWATGPLPDCPKQLANITRAPLDVWLELIAPVVMKFFTLGPNGWFQKRLEREREKAKAVLAERVAAGIEGAKRRWGETTAKRQRKRKSGDGTPMAHPSKSASAARFAQQELPLEDVVMASEALEKPAVEDDPDLSWQTGAPSPSQKDSDTPYLPPEAKTPSLWTDGLAATKALVGRSDRGCRELLGKWRKQLRNDDKALTSVLEAAKQSEVADPVSWIESEIAGRKKARRQQPAAKADWWQKPTKAAPAGNFLEAFRQALGEPLARVWLAGASLDESGGRVLVASRFKADHLRENHRQQLDVAARRCGLARSPDIAVAAA